MLLSPELWILGGKLSLDPSVTETGYPELITVRISLSLTRGLPCSVSVVTETGGVITLDGLDEESANRLDTELPKSLDDGGKLPSYSKGSTRIWYTLFSKAKRRYFLLSGCIST